MGNFTYFAKRNNSIEDMLLRPDPWKHGRWSQEVEDEHVYVSYDGVILGDRFTGTKRDEGLSKSIRKVDDPAIQKSKALVMAVKRLESGWRRVL